MKTFVYGDSFSNAELSKCPPDKMWYAPFVEGELIDRTRPGASTEEMFLLAINDAVTNKNCRFLLGTGMMYSRLAMYTDDLYEKEQVRQGKLADCLPFFQTKFLSKTSFVFGKDYVSLFHHTLVWSKYLSNIITLNTLMQSQQHKWVAVHLGTPRDDYQSWKHPLVLPLLQRTAAIANYVDQRNSCFDVCKDAGIKPWDYDQYSWNGHHTTEGQQHFGAHIKNILQSRGVLI